MIRRRTGRAEEDATTLPHGLAFAVIQGREVLGPGHRRHNTAHQVGKLNT